MISSPHKLVLSVGLRRGFIAYRCFLLHCSSKAYHQRAGIEGVHSQGVRTMGLRRSRYIGLRKTHQAHVAVAAAMSLVQLTHWLRGEAPEQTRVSPFKRAMKPAV